MIVCAGNGEEFDFARAVGVGLVDCAINLIKILASEKHSEILFVGSCGLYGEGKIFDIFECETATNHEISELLGYSYSPIFDPNVSYETFCNSSNFITTDEICAQKFATLGYKIENMEFYSVVKVAESFKIPARGIFVATNFCNQNAHADFLKNHAKAKEILENYLKQKGII
ncbi:purine-nucleoside phosphorylase [Campylobacter sp. VBCF_06 NA8]|nr:purine-nucleoside phosphorylase [Campylobacter sp. VBCF_06 NA8]MDA3045699.1 purine-nucleoside phosphorylase [Campylobacter sp. VBCF_06 NA8]